MEIAGTLLASRSLWDRLLALPPPGDGGARRYELAGPHGEALLVLERRLVLPASAGGAAARDVVAMDRAELPVATRDFLRDLAPYLGLLAATLIAAGWVQVAVGLKPLAAVGARVAAVRSGAAARLGGDFPDEERPLAAVVDALIAAREADIARARTRASDLAHGLKTPTLIGEARRLALRGEAEAAAGIEDIAAAMQRHVDRELSRARIATPGWSTSCNPAAVIGRVLAVVRKTPDGGRLDWRLAAPEGLRVRIDADDLTEEMGALLENAARHARRRVEVAVECGDATIGIAVRDDGPGVEEARFAELGRRGARLDATAPGEGLGLAIASEIIDAAGGGLALRNTPAGFEAVIGLPAAQAPPC